MNPQEPQNIAPTVYQAEPLPEQQPVGSSKKTGVLIGVGIVVVAVVVVGGWLVTRTLNSPDRIWKSAVTNTNRMTTAFADYFSNPNANGYDVSGTFKVHDSVGGNDVSGTTMGSVQQRNSTFSMKIPVGGSTATIDTLAKGVDGSDSPDVYYRISGVAALGTTLQKLGRSSDFVDSANKVDGKWLFASHETGVNAENYQVALNMPLPESRLKSASEKLTGLTNDYLLSSDASKAVFSNKRNVGTEKIDKRSVYHYRFTFDPAHYKQYVSGVVSALGGKTVSDDKIARLMGFDTMSTALSAVEGKPTADVWVDKSTKTIRRVRIPVTTTPGNYAETGFTYTGGNVYPLYVSLKAKGAEVTMSNDTSLALDTKAKSFVYAYASAIGDSQSDKKLSASTKVSPRATNLTVTPPAGTSDIGQYASDLNNVTNGLFNTSTTTD